MGGIVLRRIRTLVMPLAVTAALVATPAAAHAGGVVDPAPIGPNQFFTGEVNGASAPAVIRMNCMGAVTPGATGHPLANQTVDALPVAPPASTEDGYTGSAGHRIEVTFADSSSATPVVLTSWAVRGAIPTALTLPCSGPGTVVFTPAPASPTSRSAVVRVTYVSQP
jgi:hypothetical protein